MSYPTVVRNRTRTEKPEPGEEHLLCVLEHAKLPDWTVYEQPHLNGDHPDFVLVNPKRGVVIIEVKDLRLDNGRYARGDHRTIRVLGNNGAWHPMTNPVAQVQRYWSNITKVYSRQFLALEERFGDQAFAVVERAVYFHNVSAQTARTICGEDRNIRYLDRSHVEAIQRGQLGQCGLDTLKYANTSKFAAGGLLEAFVEDLQPWLNPTLYQSERLTPLVLAPEQEPHAVPQAGLRRRLRGVAGSGKTLVLATRAARLLEQGKRVLIFTFNITLQHYVRDLVKQQYTGADPSPLHTHLVIRYFHDFLEWVADKHDIELPNVLKDARGAVVDHILTVEWPQAVRRGIEDGIKPVCMFDAILIDEGQDFTRDWAELCFQFLTAHDEVLLVYDHIQNIYERELVWVEDDAAGLGFRGRPATLQVSRRLPSTMAHISADVVSRFGLSNEILSIQVDEGKSLQGTLFGPTLRWTNLYNMYSNEDLAAKVIEIVREVLMREYGFHPNDIAVLTEDEKTALPVVESLQGEGFGVSHVFDLSGGGDHHVKRQEKWRFQPTDGKIKVCTVHSFKGWESPCILLLVGHPGEAVLSVSPEPPRKNAALLYVALTRLKSRRDLGASVFFGINLDPRLDDVGLIFDKYTLA